MPDYTVEQINAAVVELLHVDAKERTMVAAWAALAFGHRAADVAEALGISAKDVEEHVRQVQRENPEPRRLGTLNRIQGYLAPPPSTKRVNGLLPRLGRIK